MAIKELYTVPTVKILFVRVEGMLCQSTGTTGVSDWETPGSEFPLPF